jgi:hypothetical protein
MSYAVVVSGHTTEYSVVGKQGSSLYFIIHLGMSAIAGVATMAMV